MIEMDNDSRTEDSPTASWKSEYSGGDLRELIHPFGLCTCPRTRVPCVCAVQFKLMNVWHLVFWRLNFTYFRMFVIQLICDFNNYLNLQYARTTFIVNNNLNKTNNLKYSIKNKL